MMELNLDETMGRMAAEKGEEHAALALILATRKLMCALLDRLGLHEESKQLAWETTREIVELVELTADKPLQPLLDDADQLAEEALEKGTLVRLQKGMIQ